MTGRNFSAAGLDAVGEAIGRHVAEGYAPGAVGLVDRQGETHVFTVGTAATDAPRPMARDTIFRIASMTKPIVAAAVMMLVEDGLVRLDEPVDRLLPELADRPVLRSIAAALDDTVPADRPITVEDLLTFRCGMGVLLAPPNGYPIQRAIAGLNLMGFGMPDPSVPYDGEEWLARLETLPLMAQPGGRWLYTTGSNIQGVLIARAAGKPLSTFLAERIFAPLGMRDTAFFVPAAKQDRFVPFYEGRDGALTARDDPATGAWSGPPRFEAGDSGLVSTVDDMLTFARMMLNHGALGDTRLLSPASVAAMTADRLTAEQRTDGYPILAHGDGWGYGLAVTLDAQPDGPAEGSFGWTGGFGTSWFSDPAQDLTAILLTQRVFTNPVLPAIHADFRTAARAAVI